MKNTQTLPLPLPTVNAPRGPAVNVLQRSSWTRVLEYQRNCVAAPRREAHTSWLKRHEHAPIQTAVGDVDGNDPADHLLADDDAGRRSRVIGTAPSRRWEES